ncbi:MAG: hypothetical protein IJU81_01015 [Bacteroidales bacterium]|nr:hypothetical protein [Bacteroidales bacterium]
MPRFFPIPARSSASRSRLSPLFFLLLSLFPSLSPAQPALRLVSLDSSHPFIRYKADTLYSAPNSGAADRFFDKWSTLAATGRGHISIVHIGGSHVQAGTFPHRVRQNLLAAYPHLVSDRGMIFPYSAARKCNNPADYKIHRSHPLQLTRNVYKEPDVPLGLCGIAVTARDSLAAIAIVIPDSLIAYRSTQVVLFGLSPDSVVPLLGLQGREVPPSYIDSRTRRYVFNLSSSVDSFCILLPCKAGQSFSLTGVYLANKRPGFSYHSIGVNGAAVPDYIKCSYLSSDLRSLRPDLVIFGIGINDANAKDFDTAAFRQSYLQLVDSIRSVCPNCLFLFVTNNDAYRRTGRRSYSVNTNGLLARDVFYRLANDTGGLLWDQFYVMGGLRSMDKWRIAKLAQHDRVHFTRSGYELVGDLLTNALFKAYNDYIAHNKAPVNSILTP